MLERYWGRNGLALQGPRGECEFIETPPHEEALARLGYLVAHRRRFGLMVGPSGTGKSLVLQAAGRDAKRLGREIAAIDLFEIDSHDLLWQLAVALRLGPTERCSHATLWRMVCDHWNALHAARVPSVVLFDHLERAEVDCVGVIERLLHLDAANDGCLTVLVAAREGFAGGLPDELADQSDLRIELPRLNCHETAMFVASLLGKAGVVREILRRDALETLFELSAGSPREIVRLCQLAWLAAERDALDRIDSETLYAVAGELLPATHRRPTKSRPGFLVGQY